MPHKQNREPWQMTKLEWEQQGRTLTSQYNKLLVEKLVGTGFENEPQSPVYRCKAQQAMEAFKKQIGRSDIDFGTLAGAGHRAFVRDAIEAKKHVSSLVLANYPNLTS